MLQNITITDWWKVKSYKYINAPIFIFHNNWKNKLQFQSETPSVYDSSAYICTLTHTDTYTHMHRHLCTHACAHTHIHTHTCVRTHAQAQSTLQWCNKKPTEHVSPYPINNSCIHTCTNICTHVHTAKEASFTNTHSPTIHIYIIHTHIH